MIIKSIEASGLSRSNEPLFATFHNDINIITGRNGSGKTTLLKLMWYIISGNIEYAVREVPFLKVRLVTSDYDITLIRISGMQIRVEILINDEIITLEDYHDEDIGSYYDAEDQANNIVNRMGSSVFFPTFRRIEGGFSLGRPNNSGNISLRASSRAKGEIEEALLALSQRMSVERHAFVSSISTVDIVSLLMKNYTAMSELSNDLQNSVSQDVIDDIKSYKLYNSPAVGDVSRAERVIDSIMNKIEGMDAARAKIMLPLDAVRVLVERLFKHSGIKLNTRLSFGDVATAVNSDALSAGEKQMLSFICYNAFYDDSIIFIDEPELSLHVDWQRQLFPILREQKKSNQFIIATHSPFIYGKYPDKEILMSLDRGADISDVD